MKSFWDDRYSAAEYVYGEDPNVFFAEQLKKLTPGKIILPCDGEGRNAVYAALLGWEVMAFDSSGAGKIKAEKLAQKRNVKIDFIIGDALTINYTQKSVDVVALIYAHLPAQVRKRLNNTAVNWLKPGGRIILEAFNPNQIGNLSGGPKEVSMLLTEQIIKEDFGSLQVKLLQMVETELYEGEFHKGKADVLRFIGQKVENPDLA